MNDAIPTPTPPAATPSALEWDPSRISQDEADELIERVEELIDAVSVAKRKVDDAIDDGQDQDDAIAGARGQIDDAQTACEDAQCLIPGDAVLGDLELALYEVRACLTDPDVSDLDRAERAAEDALTEALAIETVEEDWEEDENDDEEDPA
jgi:hypothetical protein